MLELLGAQLKTLGFDPVTHSRGETALEWLDTEGPPDLALLDLKMEGPDGLDVCRRIKSQFADKFVPVVAVTAASDALSRREAHDSGADGFLAKPYDMATLQITVESMLRLRTLMMRLSLQSHDLKQVEDLKRNFLAMVSHEFRTPLAKITGFSDNLFVGVYGDLPEEVSAIVTRIKTEATRLNSMLNQILEISKSSIDDRKMIRTQSNLTQIVNSVLEDHGELAGRLRHEVRADLPDIWLDAGLMADVLNHIITNAEKFTTRDIVVKYHLVSDDLPRMFEHVHAPLGDALYPGRPYLGVEILDQGEGIAPANLKRIFDKFYQVDSSSTRSKSGLGIGLSFVERVVQRHAGLLIASSEVGRGSSFLLLLPVDLRGDRALA